MKIGIDARPLSLQVTGVPRVLSNLIRELERIDDENEYYLYSKLDFELPFENQRWHKRLHSKCLSHPSTFRFQTGARHMIRRDGLDVFCGTTHIFPFGLPSSLAKVLIVYDLVWRFYPETMSLRNYLVHRFFAERAVRAAHRLITISESTRKGLERELGIPREKVSVAYPAAGPGYEPREQSRAARYIASRYGTSDDYICTVGTVEPRKNLITLVKAVKLLGGRGAFKSQLVVAGGSGWKNSKIYATVNRLGLTDGDVKFLGYLPDEDLPRFYSGARLLVFPSLYEGFGLPLVEAMACGIPIVASKVSSIPEVVQDAAVLVSPDSPEEFADAIARVSADPDLRAALIKKELNRSRQFRWETAAAELLRVLREASRRATPS